MMRYLQRLGKSLMLPVACLPVAAILQGIGYWIDPTGWGANNVIAAFLLKGGGCLIDQMPILFAIGVAVGMSDDNDGTAGLAGLVSWIMTTTLLSTDVVAMLTNTAVEKVDPAFGKVQTQFIGILCGLIAAACYNKFKNTKLPDAFSFFSGKRCVAIVTAGASLISSLVLFFVWPIIYNVLVAVGKFIMDLGPIGAGLYGFFNRLLIPIGLAVGAVYYVVFRFVIVKFNMKTPGREDDNIDETKVELANNDFTGIAKIVLEGVGGPANVTSIDNCITRLRLEIKDYTLIDEHKIKSAGVAGVIRPSKTAVQVIIGTKVQFVADEFKKLCK